MNTTKIQQQLAKLKERLQSFNLNEGQIEMILNDAKSIYYQGQTDKTLGCPQQQEIEMVKEVNQAFNIIAGA